MNEINTDRNGAPRLFAALRFAAEKHTDQRRKNERQTPYINHPIAVAELLTRIGGLTDSAMLEAAVLHDTIEDTDTTAEELQEEFGSEVRALVEEVTDDKSLPKLVRKRLQIEHTPDLSSRARQIKLADKICNLKDIAENPPAHWDMQRRRNYCDWAEKVAAGCRGLNPGLEQEFDTVLSQTRQRVSA